MSDELVLTVEAARPRVEVAAVTPALQLLMLQRGACALNARSAVDVQVDASAEAH